MSRNSESIPNGQELQDDDDDDDSVSSGGESSYVMTQETVVDSEDESVEDAAEDETFSNSSSRSSNIGSHRRSRSPATDLLQINVKVVGKETSDSLLIAPAESVGDLKCQIASHHSIPIERQRLIYFGRLLVDDSQALGPTGIQMRLGVINYVHLSPLPEGAKPSARPKSTKQEGERSPVDEESPIAGPGSSFASAVSDRHRNDVEDYTLPPPDRSLQAQIARARRFGAEARERRRRRMLETHPYRYPERQDTRMAPEDALSAHFSDDEEFSLRPSSPRATARPSMFLDRPIVPPSLSHHSLFSPPSLFSRRAAAAATATDWTDLTIESDLGPYSYSEHLPAARPLWPVPPRRQHRDRLDTIPMVRREDYHDNTNDNNINNNNNSNNNSNSNNILLHEDPVRRSLIQQTRRSALQLLPAVAEWHAQLERLSRLSTTSGSAVDDILVQQTLEQMDFAILNHWSSRLRPLLREWQLQDARDLWASGPLPSWSAPSPRLPPRYFGY